MTKWSTDTGINFYNKTFYRLFNNIYSFILKTILSNPQVYRFNQLIIQQDTSDIEDGIFTSNKVPTACSKKTPHSSPEMDWQVGIPCPWNLSTIQDILFVIKDSDVRLVRMIDLLCSRMTHHGHFQERVSINRI